MRRKKKFPIRQKNRINKKIRIRLLRMIKYEGSDKTKYEHLKKLNYFD